ncbi:MAG: HAMP domain-containing sensor histidine kinase [Patescibacteria group bacterium]
MKPVVTPRKELIEKNKELSGAKFNARVPLFVKTFFFFVAPTLIIFAITVIFLVAGYERLVVNLFDALNQKDAIVDSSFVVKNLEEMRMLAEVVVSVFLFIVISGSMALVFVLNEPLRELIRGMREVMKGNLSVSIKVATRDEIGELARIFNLMVAKIRVARDREQEIATLKHEFVSIVAHQFRTPLTSMKWVLEAISSGDAGALTKNQIDLLEKGKISSDQLSDVLSDLLNMVQAEEGKFKHSPKNVEIVAFMQDIVRKYKELAQEKGITFEYETKMKAHSIPLDEEKFTLAIGSVIMNAITYTPRGGFIKLSLGSSENTLHIKVKDTGIGISKKDISKLFTKFSRGENALLVHPDGSGIGLYVAKNIIDKHEGRIWYEPEEEKGSVFHIELPIKNA